MPKNLGFILLVFFSFSVKSNGQCLVTTGPTNDCSYGDAIDNITINGVSVSNSGCSNGSGYSYFPTPVWQMEIGASYPISLLVGGNTYNQGVRIWIDLNNNGQFESTESVFNTTTAALSHTGTLVIPNTATAATVRMRVMCTYNRTATAAEACTSGVGSYGEAEDYQVTLMLADVEATAVVYPMHMACGQVDDSVVVRVTNLGMATYTDLPLVTNVSGIINGTFKDTIASLGPMASEDVFVTSLNTSEGGNLDIQFFIEQVDNNLLNDSFSTSISINALPVLTISANTPVCAQQSLNLSEDGGEVTSWEWSGPDNFTSTEQNPSLENVTEAAAGSYQVIGIDANGCIDSLSIEVTVIPESLAVTDAVLDMTPAQDFQAVELLTSDAVISPPDNIVFVAGTSIELTNPFTVVSGAAFTAKIQGCVSGQTMVAPK